MYFQTRLLPDKLDLITLCDTKPDHYPYALISTVSFNVINSRYDIYFAYPQEALILDHNGTLLSNAVPELEQQAGFLNAFDDWWKSLRTTRQSHATTDLPFNGGWFVFLSYEFP